MMIGYAQEKISQRVVHSFVKDVTSASSQKVFFGFKCLHVLGDIGIIGMVVKEE